jgi:peptide-methionine (S)-S-oxide reductase
MFFDNPFKTRLPKADEALAGRSTPIFAGGLHAVLGNSMTTSMPPGFKQIILGLGCFWGAERLFWKLPGIFLTAVGYSGGLTANPTYEETCSGQTGHTEVVLLVYDPKKLTLDKILSIFWQAHDPTQGFKQGNDRGTQYRSALFVMDDADFDIVQQSAGNYQKALAKSGFGQITTEIRKNQQFYFAEDHHQQYLYKVPSGYCGLQGTGVCLD